MWFYKNWLFIFITIKSTSNLIHEKFDKNIYNDDYLKRNRDNNFVNSEQKNQEDVYFFHDNFENFQIKDNLINIYFKLKNLVTKEARYVLLKAKYVNSQQNNRYIYYSNRLKKISDELMFFINQNKIILDNFTNHINDLSLSIDKDFFNQMYVYAQNNNSKKTDSKNLYLRSKFYSQKLIDENMKKIEEIKNKNLQRVDMFFKNKNQILSDEDQKIYKIFHENIEKLVSYQEQIISQTEMDFIQKFKKQYKKTITYYNNHKNVLLNMKKGDFCSTYCDNILYSTYSINLLIEILQSTKNCFHFILNKTRIYKTMNLHNQFKLEVKNNNNIIKNLLKLSLLVKNL